MTRAHDDVLVHLRRARDHADRHFDQPLTLAQLAAVAALSPWHFQRLFTVRPGCGVPRRARESWGAPRIPGCWVFMRGMTASREKQPGDVGP